MNNKTRIIDTRSLRAIAAQFRGVNVNKLHETLFQLLRRIKHESEMTKKIEFLETFLDKKKRRLILFCGT